MKRTLSSTKTLFAAIASLTLFLSFSPAFGQTKPDGKNDLSVTVKVEKEVRTLKDGKTIIELKPADKSRKSDILVYTVVYKNKHDFDVKNVSIFDPIPAGAEYIMDSAAGKGTSITFSIDGGKSFVSPPVMYKKPAGNGTLTVPAPADMYTHIKWLIKGSVKPGGSGKVSFKVKVK